MTTNSPNPVDGDVQALIADCRAEIAELEKVLAIDEYAAISHLQSKLKRQQVALAALTAEPVGNFEYHKDEDGDVTDFIIESDGLSKDSFKLYATPPAQVLRPVELPDVKTARSDWSTWQWIEHLGGRFQNGNPGGYIEFGSVYAVAQMMKQYRRTVTAEVIAEIAEALRQQGYEVKND